MTVVPEAARPLSAVQASANGVVPIPVADIQVVTELYPRLRGDETTIEQYRSAIDLLPPIEIARGRILVDGYHRLQAHQREGLSMIDAIDLGDLTDEEILDRAIRTNASHGHQLSRDDKKRLGPMLYERGDKLDAIATLLSVDDRSVRRWTQDARAAAKAQLQARAYDLWLNCLSTREIAEQLDVAQKTVADWLSGNGQLSESAQPPAATDDKPWGSVQHFDVWQFQNADGDSNFFGRMPPQVVENLLWLYTDPGDVVIDPFAGGGTTIDVAKRMGRRIWASDLTPSTPLLPIHQHDATEPWPAPLKAQLIVLDPPYWQQAKGRYSDKPDDLGNVNLDAFIQAWRLVIINARTRLADDGRIAFIVSPTQLDDGRVIDHAFDMAHVDGLRVERRIIVPYQTQQATGQQVTWARENKRLLKLYRDLVVLRPA